MMAATRSYEDMFRPAYELAAAAGWIGGIALLLVLRPPYWLAFSAVAGTIGAWRVSQALGLYRFRVSISGFRVTLLELVDMFKEMRVARSNKCLFLGYGFEWEQHHAEIADHIYKRNAGELGTLPDWLPDAVKKFVMPKDGVPIKDTAIGAPWIHGLNPEETPILLPIEALVGHTLITATTRAIKTRLFELLTFQVIHSESVLICIDPKGDKEWEHRLRWECQRAGRKFLFFHPAHPARSIRLNPLANWNNISEPATRISQLVDADGSFAAFAWKTLYRIMRGMAMNGEKPSIAGSKRYIQMGVEPLLESLLAKHLLALDGPNWDRDLANFMGQQNKSKLTAMIQMYLDDKRSRSMPDETIEALVSMHQHSKEHFSKMIQVLEPIMEMLGSDEIGKMLSPDPTDLSDTRPIYDTRRVIEEKCVLYIGLDSLSNQTIGSAVGSVILADLASVAGSIYNFSDKTDLYLFIDEAAEVINEQTIQILNKAGGAGFKAFLACQTIADFEARFGSTAKARQVLGNLNNVICGRLRDWDTARWISDGFGKTEIRNAETSFSTGAESGSSFTEFRSNTSRSLKRTEAPLVDPGILTRLPPLQFFAYLAGSRVYKGRIPLVQQDWRPAK